MRTRVVAAAVVTAAVGGAAAARRRTSGPDGWPELQGRAVSVTADDGLLLHADVYGPEDATGTVVFAHGYVLDSGLWARQVQALLEARPDLRVVTYDQRGHGRSQRGSRSRCSIAQLGQDLRAVLDELAPAKAMVVGHSMGGMTIMALAEAHPSLFGDRVVAVGLVATSSGGLADLTFGFPPAVANRLRTIIPLGMAQGARREDAGKKALPQPFLRPVLFGKDPQPGDVRRTLASLGACSPNTMADFFETFLAHERLSALKSIAQVPMSIQIGTSDKLCPIGHSRTIADALPHAELHVYPGAGHMLMLERADEVSARLIDLAGALSPRLSTV